MSRDYLALITQEHKRPRFLATVDASCKPFAAIQELLRGFSGAAFDVDSASGAQLDTIGRWVGVPRAAQVPLAAYAFTWDDKASTGWDNGAWEGVGGFVDLPDDLYRILIKAKIKANHWLGDIPTAYEILEYAIGEDKARIVDGGGGDVSRFYFSWDGSAQNGWDSGAWGQTTGDIMTMLVFLRDSMPAIEKALVTSGALPIKPAGVTAIYSTFGG